MEDDISNHIYIPTDLLTPEFLTKYLDMDQIVHVNNTLNILDHYYVFFDISTQGAGKSRHLAMVAYELGLPLFSIGNMNSQRAISAELKELGIDRGANKVKFELEVTINLLRGVKDVLNDLIDQYFDIEETVKTRKKRGGGYQEYSSYKFIPRQKLYDLLRNGVLFVLDEAQIIKNNSRSHKVVAALLKALLKVGGRSRAYFMSGTLFTKPETSVFYFKMLRVMKNYKMLYRKVRGMGTEELGISEIVDVCRILDYRTTTALKHAHDRRKSSKETYDVLCNELLCRVFLPRISSYAPFSGLMEGFTYYLYIGEQDQYKAINGISKELRGKLTSSKKTKKAKQELMKAITSSLPDIHFYMYDSVIKEAARILIDNPNHKVIIFAEYIDKAIPQAYWINEGKTSVRHVDYLTDILDADFPDQVLSIIGKTKDAERVIIAKKFQQDNNKYRILIGSIKVLSESISLDDRVGDRVRHTFLFPDYNFATLDQAARRTVRRSTKSVPYVYFCMPFIPNDLYAILHSVASKAEVSKMIHRGYKEEGRKFVGGYDMRLEKKPEMDWKYPSFPSPVLDPQILQSIKDGSFTRRAYESKFGGATNRQILEDLQDTLNEGATLSEDEASEGYSDDEEIPQPGERIETGGVEFQDDYDEILENL